MTAINGDPIIHHRVEVDGEVIDFAIEAAPVDEHLEELHDLDSLIRGLDARIEDLDGRIDPLTNHSDRLDVAVAVSSGVLAGAVDSLWVGEFSLMDARLWGEQHVNKFVMEVARRNGYEGSSMAGAVRRLEKVFPFAGDDATKVFGGGRLHHLRDLTHHPSPVGLIASLVLQFTGQAWGVTFGQLSPVDLAGNPHIGANAYQKLLSGTVGWLGHLISDVAGSSANAGAGTGLPGPLMSTIYSAAAQWQKLTGAEAPGRLMEELEKAFRGSDLAVPFDFRTELGLVNQVGRQSLPVILNDVIVRAFYFVRRFIEARSAGMGWRESIMAAKPWGNRTIARMLTISTATFSAVDLADAAVRAAAKSGGEPATFAALLLLRVNYVGAVRTTVALAIDARRGVQRSRLADERAICINERLRLLNTRSFYLIAGTWTEAEGAEQAVTLAEQAAAHAASEFRASWFETLEAEKRVSPLLDDVRENDPEFTQLLLETLRRGRSD
ncbi:hypothetical protein [Demequina salsinemoris]|uniref:hypothetical protein n=1 Tax=Demequina salsinemoris TaxID=577470 RepID=UPI000780E1F2|nr:hypothetical protein [Demequina salsinemoris]